MPTDAGRGRRGAAGPLARGYRGMLTRLGDPERGAFVVEAVWLMPALILLLFAGIQYTWWYDAGATCQGAAAAGAAAAAGMTASGGAGSAAAQAFLAGQADSSVQGASVSEALSATSVRVTCTGSAQEVIPLPGMTLTVQQSATAPRERWVTP